jgi:hypothetical protein
MMMGDDMGGEIGGMFGRGTEVLEKKCPRVVLSTTNPT